MAVSTIKAHREIQRLTVSGTANTGSSVVTKVGAASVSAGIGTVNFNSSVPDGKTFVALIPSQASRADGVDVAYAIVPDDSKTSIRIYGTPNVSYNVNAELLYK